MSRLRIAPLIRKFFTSPVLTAGELFFIIAHSSTNAAAPAHTAAELSVIPSGNDATVSYGLTLPFRVKPLPLSTFIPSVTGL